VDASGFDATSPEDATSEAGPSDDASSSTDGAGDDSSVDGAGDDASGDGARADGAGTDGAGPDGAIESGSTDAAGTGDACLPGLTCNVSCPGGGTTSVTGKVYDPAGKNPVFNVTVYVPAGPLLPLPKGVAVGTDACSCEGLFKSGAITSTRTAVDGTFTLKNVPAGSAVPLVLQIGKWRRSLHVNVTGCQPNPQPDRSLVLPGTVAPGSDDNMPDFAVSTGSADSLECLFLRMGIPASEYVAGTGSAGHVHVFSGGGTGGAGGAEGRPEANPMPGAPASSTSLWSTAGQLMPYDVTLLSCEGGETYSANPPALESYLNAGGRVFASHFHYAWFAGPLATMQSYAAPADWGPNLATWVADNGTTGTGPIGGIIDLTLNGTSKPFAEGVAFQQWLNGVGALGKSGLPMGELSIYMPRYNATVGANNSHSQPWVVADPASGTSGATMQFTFDAPVGAPPAPDGGAPLYCGRAAFSDLHAAGDPTTMDTSPPPAGCAAVDLSPQEKALEFTLFDLSSCVVADSAGP
jgi:hypothetical protein